ncbi:hypothetical protein SESBI_02785 [Sesbania bispinosa]|nr:hypothetical protein SESBI_02785 [Sesbania bispinosa]
MIEEGQLNVEHVVGIRNYHDTTTPNFNAELAPLVECAQNQDDGVIPQPNGLENSVTQSVFENKISADSAPPIQRAQSQEEREQFRCEKGLEHAITKFDGYSTSQGPRNRQPPSYLRDYYYRAAIQDP